jgi:hypothetical protein
VGESGPDLLMREPHEGIWPSTGCCGSFGECCDAVLAVVVRRIPENGELHLHGRSELGRVLSVRAGDRKKGASRIYTEKLAAYTNEKFDIMRIQRDV